MRASGVSNTAYDLEVRMGLDNIQLTEDTLNWLLEALCHNWQVSVPDLKLDGRLGTGTRRVRHGYYRVWAQSIKLSREKGTTVGVLVHEFCHHLAHRTLGVHTSFNGGHGYDWRRLHETVLRALSKGEITNESGVTVDMIRLKKEVRLDGLHQMYPDVFYKHWREGITADELIGKIEAEV